MRLVTATSIAALTLVITGCFGQSQQSSGPPTPGASTAALTNPIDFPLAQDSKILDVKPFVQTVSGTEMHNSALGAQGEGTYEGHEVLAASTMSADELRRWLAGLGQHPPTGYTYQTGSATVTGTVGKTLDQYGIAYAAFRGEGAAAKRGVIVVVMDPKLVKAKLGMGLDLIEQYRSLPAAVRDPIDTKFKARSGFTVTEATDPSSPFGMTLAALRELQGSDKRAIVLVEATKK
jgi:hypothetical protein